MKQINYVGMVLLSAPCSFFYALMIACQMLAIALDRVATVAMLLGMKTNTKLTTAWIGRMVG